MSLPKKALAGLLVAGSLSLGLAYAAPGAFHETGYRGHDRGGAAMRLRGLDLSEAQRDQVFKIVHAQRPAMREQMKSLREARRELAQAATAESYDSARVQAAAEAQGKAVTQLALLRAQTMQQVSQVLTPEQRAKLQERIQHGEKSRR
jgi:Spy/CpxP family protein refolding chaperone